MTIPVAVRERAGLLPNAEVEIEYDGATVKIVKARNRKSGGRGQRIVQHLRGRGTGKLTTDQIMALTRGP